MVSDELLKKSWVQGILNAIQSEHRMFLYAIFLLCCGHVGTSHFQSALVEIKASSKGGVPSEAGCGELI